MRVQLWWGAGLLAVQTLAWADTSLPVPDTDGTTPLHWAVHHGDAAQVRQLLAAGADARAVNDYGATPMSEAAERGDADLIRQLLKAGADVESANPEG